MRMGALRDDLAGLLGPHGLRALWPLATVGARESRDWFLPVTGWRGPWGPRPPLASPSATAAVDSTSCGTRPLRIGTSASSSCGGWA